MYFRTHFTRVLPVTSPLSRRVSEHAANLALQSEVDLYPLIAPVEILLESMNLSFPFRTSTRPAALSHRFCSLVDFLEARSQGAPAFEKILAELVM